jgi:hypothetical protein
MRLNELKEEKEKEVADVRAQYNAIKEEVRSYERILPTHTFLTEIGFKIYQLPTYEDIFMNLKDKVTALEQLNNKFEAHRAKTEEAARSYQQNKEMLPKIIEYEHQISDLKINN